MLHATSTRLGLLLLLLSACSRSHGSEDCGDAACSTDSLRLVVEPLVAAGSAEPLSLIADLEHPDVRYAILMGQEGWLNGRRVEVAEPWDELLARSVAGEPFAVLPLAHDPEGYPGPHFWGEPWRLRDGSADWVWAPPGVRIGGAEATTPTWFRWADDGALAEHPLPEGVSVDRALPAPAGGIWFLGQAPGTVPMGGSPLGADDSRLTFLAHLDVAGELTGRGVGTDRLGFDGAVAFADGTLGLLASTSRSGELLGQMLEPGSFFVRFDPLTLEVTAFLPLPASGELYSTPEGPRIAVGIEEPVTLGAETHRPFEWSTASVLELTPSELAGGPLHAEVWPFFRRDHAHLMRSREPALGIPADRWLGPSAPESQLVYAWFERPDAAAYLVATDGRPIEVVAEGDRVLAVVRSAGPLQVGGELLPSTLGEAGSLFVLAFEGASGRLTDWLEVPLPAPPDGEDAELRVSVSSLDEEHVALTTGWPTLGEAAVEVWRWADPSAPVVQLESEITGPGCTPGSGGFIRGRERLIFYLLSACTGPHEVRLGDHVTRFESPRADSRFELALARTP